LRTAFVLAQAIIDQRYSGLDYRTFSRRIAGHSKDLEQLEGPVVRLLARVLDLPPEAKPRAALRTIGLEKFASPLLVAGQTDLAEADLSREELTYLGITPNQVGRIRFRETPKYVLTIENFASFCRHAIEADPARVGTSIYVGGYPSLATQQVLWSLRTCSQLAFQSSIGQISILTAFGFSAPLSKRCDARCGPISCHPRLPRSLARHRLAEAR
jgi:hypothetical protein